MLCSDKVRKDMKSLIRASQIEDEGSRVSIDTGIEELDKLQGRLEGGSVYLFYGDEGFIDELVHLLIVKGAKKGKVAYMNNTDYHTAKTLLDIDRIAFYAKREGVEPYDVMQRVLFSAAYNELRQPLAATALAERIEKEEGYVMLIMHNMTRFLGDAKNRRAALEAMDLVIARLWHVAMQKSMIMLITCEASEFTPGRIPRPEGSGLLRQIARIAVFFRLVQPGLVQATLVRHPELSVPSSAEVTGSDEFMGRMTPSFRQIYQSLLERLRKHYTPLLRNEKRREAFERLVSSAWDEEHAAMANSQLPLVLDAMNLTANLQNSAEIEELRKEMKELKMMLQMLLEKNGVETGIGSE